MKTKLNTLNAVRAAACIGVFTFHSYISNLGAWAVSIFVMLSGFLLVYNGIDRADSFPTDVKGCAKYAFKKIKKLYPLYFLTLVVLMLRIALLAPEDPPVEQLLVFAKQFVLCTLLVQSWPPDIDWAFALNGVGWYLSTCVFLYFTFPYILRWVKKHKSIKGAFVSILSVSLAMFAVAGLVSLAHLHLTNSDSVSSAHFQHWFSYVFPIYRVSDFAIGCLVGYVFSRTPEASFTTAQATVLEAVSIVLAIISQQVFVKGLLPNFISFNMLFVPSSAMLVYFFALGRGRISRLLDCKLCSVIADYSVEIFLIHYTVIKYASPFSSFLPVPFALQQVIFLVFTFTVTLLAVYLYRRFSRHFPFFSVR